MYHDFHTSDDFSHGGCNAFQMLKTAGEWKVVAITDSRRRDSLSGQRGGFAPSTARFICATQPGMTRKCPGLVCSGACT
jgi:hypothetical protein